MVPNSTPETRGQLGARNGGMYPPSKWSISITSSRALWRLFRIPFRSLKIWVFPSMVGEIPPNHPWINRVFHYFHHPFWWKTHHFRKPLFLTSTLYSCLLSFRALKRLMQWMDSSEQVPGDWFDGYLKFAGSIQVVPEMKWTFSTPFKRGIMKNIHTLFLLYFYTPPCLYTFDSFLTTL